MFVPVRCASCGKPFQVPETALGKLAPCPWCQAVVTALPVSAPLPEQPVAAPAPEPLSLDDEPATVPAQPTAPPVAPAEPPAARPTFTAATFVVGLVLAVAVMVATALLLGYRSGRIPDADWAEFTPPDGSFTVALPGRPAEEDVEPLPDASLAGGKRFAVRRWYSRTAAWVAFNDLEPGLASRVRSDPGRVIAAGVLRVARDREVARLQGTITKEAEVRLNAGWGVEIQADAPGGTAVVRLILLGGDPRPRLYVYGVQGKNVAPAGSVPQRLFASFRVNE